MKKEQTPKPLHRPTHKRWPLWLAFGFALLLMGWWEWGAWSSRQSSTPAAAALDVPAGAEVAILAGGCFWCTEADFDKVPGVLGTTSGYTGGKTANPSYAEVSSHATGHAEAVRIVFDPKQVSYPQLLAIYWRSIDPTVRDRQFCDIGTPYRTAIFATSAQQLQQAKDSLAELQTSKPFAEPIQTQIQLASDFYPAEPEHQNYHQVNPVRYEFYRKSCGRDARLAQLWGAPAAR
ncbi:peptide-methionine (S)-S-oxide reductase MsrA [Rhodoferax sp.]|uniref:peptide-methionine (S)-S-oxide reductase MsrA n=1 Tax=Rhodoferax sp. TaxID=50421 RepID=UPI002624DECD|nr:peptide-methionine (S)-S-oxide reductase MsrA [Rhodoferax sp.]MDD2808681.1 peptide-methionine (S)-S-oxide reductase MsrA [Rhodoferax sp.]MDD4943770.1 peptide-methionine (S)-S-oxide reductase MsrA [Rhodoferax sp.]